MKKGFTTRTILLLAVVIILAVLFGVLLMSKIALQQPSPTPGQTPDVKPATSTTSEATIDNWTMTSASNIEFLVVNSIGQQAGYVYSLKSYVSTLPNASYGFEKGITDMTGKNPPLPDEIYFNFNNPPNDVYSLQVVGIQQGKYHIDISFLSKSDTGIQDASLDSELATNQIDTYTITFPQGTIEKVNN